MPVLASFDTDSALRAAEQARSLHGGRSGEVDLDRVAGEIAGIGAHQRGSPLDRLATPDPDSLP